MLNLDGPELFTYNILDLLDQASFVLKIKLVEMGLISCGPKFWPWLGSSWKGSRPEPVGPGSTLSPQ